MNLFAINGAAVNDSAWQDITLEGTAGIALSVEGGGLVWKLLQGTISTSLTVTGDGSPGRAGQGQIGIALTDLSAINVRHYLAGTSAILLGVAGQGSMGAVLGGPVDISMTQSLDLLRYANSEGLIGIAITAESDSRIAAKIFIDGAVPMTLDAQARGNLLLASEGLCSIALNGALDIIRWALAQGNLGISVLAQAQGYRLVSSDGLIDIAVSVQGQGSLGASITGSIDASLIGQLDLLRYAMAIGLVNVVLDANVDGKRTQAHRPDLALKMNVGAFATPYLEMRGQQFVADISLTVTGDARMGGKVRLEGAIPLSLISEVAARRYAQVSIEGRSEIALSMVAHKAGKPAIPSVYMEAPISRRLLVGRNSRETRATTSDREL